MPLAQENRAALLVGEAGEGVVEPEELVARSLRSGDGVLHGLQVVRPLHTRAAIRGALAR